MTIDDFVPFKERKFTVQNGYEIRPILRFPSELDRCLTPDFWVYTTVGLGEPHIYDTGYSLVRNPALNSDTAPSGDGVLFYKEEVVHNATGENVGTVLSYRGEKRRAYVYDGQEYYGLLTGTVALHGLMGHVIGNDRK